jgi:beta-lactamase class A
VVDDLVVTPESVLFFRHALMNRIITSDNVCTQAALERIGPDTMTGYCQRLGMADTNHRGLIPRTNMLAGDHPAEAVATTTQGDQVLLLALILRGTEDEAVAGGLGSSSQLCQQAVDILSWQLLRSLLPSLLPAGTKLAHKTGRGRMDAGIVFANGKPRFILAAATDWVPDSMPDGLPSFAASLSSIGCIAGACWDEF